MLRLPPPPRSPRPPLFAPEVCRAVPGLVGRDAAQRSSAVVLAGRTGRWLRIGDVSRDETGVSRADARADTAPRVDLDPATVFRAMAALAIGMGESLAQETKQPNPKLVLSRPNPSRQAAVADSENLVSQI